MAKVRQDAWSHEDDLLLAETVLRHVREGSTQLKAFEEVGDKLNRTSAACGFRWNAEVRKNYKDAMELAKRQRKERKRALEKKKKSSRKSYNQNYKTKDHLSASETSQLTMDHVIQFLKEAKQNFEASHQSKYRIEQIKTENNQLHEEIKELKSKLRQTENQLKVIQEDYQTFIQIMDRARKMTVFEEDGPLKAPKFKMDKNGNLEQIAQGFE